MLAIGAAQDIPVALDLQVAKVNKDIGVVQAILVAKVNKDIGVVQGILVALDLQVV